MSKRGVMLQKMVDEGTPRVVASTQAIINWQYMSESTFSELWNLIQNLPHPRGMLNEERDC